ncbi:MAG: hydantoinase/oxoprolinase family protein, partial [Chloroflexi bacterium]|nr:hydantoinase/oxoprolinase family protein [Chloroflexota bacterium]
MRYKLAFDTGGTFTDLVMLDEQVGEMAVGKTLTTPKDPAVGVLQGIQELLEREKVDLTTTSMVVGGATTLVTNAIIERKGAKTALITTEGFRDIVEMGREMRYDLYDLFIEMPEPIVSPQLRFEVRERLDKDGNVTTPLDEAGVRAAIREIVAQGAEAVAVCLLHSYQNPVHERRIGEILAAEAPDLRVTLSSELVPEIREYERASTTMLNAYVQPLMKKHIDRLEEGLRELGYSGDLYLMLSNGGTITGQAAAQFPVKLIESGPAAGALAAVFYGRLSGEPNLLSFDMGGTTA